MTTNIGPSLFCHSFRVTLFYTPWMTSLNGHIMVIGRLAWSLHIRVTCYILYFESPTHLLGQISSPIVDSITSRNDSVYTLISPSFLGSIWIYLRTLIWFLGRLHRKLFTIKFFVGFIQTRMLKLTCLPKQAAQCEEVRFDSILSDEFTTNMAVINPPKRKLSKCTYVLWAEWQVFLTL